MFELGIGVFLAAIISTVFYLVIHWGKPVPKFPILASVIALLGLFFWAIHRTQGDPWAFGVILPIALFHAPLLWSITLWFSWAIYVITKHYAGRQSPARTPSPARVAGAKLFLVLLAFAIVALFGRDYLAKKLVSNELSSSAIVAVSKWSWCINYHNVSLAIAKSTETPEGVFRTLRDRSSHWNAARLNAAENPNLPIDMMQEMVDEPDSILHQHLARNPKLPDGIAVALLSKDRLVRRDLAYNKQLSPTIQEMLAKDPDPSIRNAVSRQDLSF